jgi:uncharacterized protein YjbI with pentapeptide repeats
MANIKIKARFFDKILFEGEYESTKKCLEAAVSKKADLKGAYLKGADLKGTDLKGAYLKGADLKGADLKGAYLKGADLKGADLERAYLKGADLKGAYLEGAYLKGAYLKGADLEDIKKDFFSRLSLAKNEVAGLYDHLIRGQINGSCYEGECACFCGTIANIRGEKFNDMKIDLKPDSSSPTEKWFLAIDRGDTPESNQVSKITAEWLREFMKKNDIAIPEYKLISSLEFPAAFAA